MTFSSLSGFWTGVYDYPDNALEATPFNAHIIDTNGILRGQIEENDLIDTHFGGSGTEVFADITGVREEYSISFTKKYAPFSSEYLDIVEYEGVVNDEFTKIEGMWTVTDEAGTWSGPFIMNRSSGFAEQVEVEQGELLEIKS